MYKVLSLSVVLVLICSCGQSKAKPEGNEANVPKTDEVIWSKTFFSELQFELQNPCMEEDDEPINVFVPRKVCQVDHQWFDTEDQSTLVHHIWKAWDERRMVGFSDVEMKKPFTFAEAKLMKDTFFLVQTGDKSPDKHFQAFLQSPQEITGFRVQQKISYDKANGRFVWSSNAIGLVRNNDKVLVWFPVTQMPSFIDMNTPDIGWAYNARLNNVVLEADTTQQETGSLMAAKNDFINQFLNAPDMEYFNGIPLAKASQESRAKLYETKDTLITFDPKTFEQVTTISQTKLEAKVFNTITFKTTWAFDSKHGHLMARMDFFKPLLELNSDDPELKFKMPLATCR